MSCFSCISSYCACYVTSMLSWTISSNPCSVCMISDAAFCENQLEDARGHAANKLEEELGYLMRDVDDSSRSLRMARAERDAASNRVSDLEERNWALLSEYEAARSFEDGMD